MTDLNPIASFQQTWENPGPSASTPSQLSHLLYQGMRVSSGWRLMAGEKPLPEAKTFVQVCRWPPPVPSPFPPG